MRKITETIYDRDRPFVDFISNIDIEKGVSEIDNICDEDIKNSTKNLYTLLNSYTYFYFLEFMYPM